MKDGGQLGLDFFLRSLKLYAKPHHSLAFFLELLNRSQDFGDQTAGQLNLLLLDLKPNRCTSALGGVTSTCLINAPPKEMLAIRPVVDDPSHSTAQGIEVSQRSNRRLSAPFTNLR